MPTTATEEDLRAYYRGSAAPAKPSPEDADSLESNLRAYYQGKRVPASPAAPAPPPPDPSTLSGAFANLKNLPKLVTEGIPKAAKTFWDTATSPEPTMGQELATAAPWLPIIPAVQDIISRTGRGLSGITKGVAELGPEKAKPLTEALANIAMGGRGALEAGAGMPRGGLAGARTPSFKKAPPLPPEPAPPPMPQLPQFTGMRGGDIPMGPKAPDNAAPIGPANTRSHFDPANPRPPMKYPTPEKIDEVVSQYMGGAPKRPPVPDKPLPVSAPALEGELLDAAGRPIQAPNVGPISEREKLRSLYKGREPAGRERIDLTGPRGIPEPPAEPPAPPDWFDPSSLPPKPPKPGEGWTPPAPSGRPSADPGVFGIEMDKSRAPMPPPAAAPTPSPELALRDYTAPGGTKVVQQIGDELVTWTKTDRNEWQGWVAGAHRKLTGESALNLAANPPAKVVGAGAPAPSQAPVSPPAKLSPPPEPPYIPPGVAPPPLTERLPVNPRALPVKPPDVGPPSEMVTLYRGEGTENVALPEWAKVNAGQWFTSNRDKAEKFARERSGRMRSVQIPQSELEQYLAPSGNALDEYLIPQIVQKNRGASELPLPPRFEATPEGMQGVIGGTPAPTMPQRALKAPVAQQAPESSPLFGQERAARSEATEGAQTRLEMGGRQQAAVNEWVMDQIGGTYGIALTRAKSPEAIQPAVVAKLKSLGIDPADAWHATHAEVPPPGVLDRLAGLSVPKPALPEAPPNIPVSMPPPPKAPDVGPDPVASAIARRNAAEAKQQAAIDRLTGTWNEGGTASGRREPTPQGNIRVDPEWRVARAEAARAEAELKAAQKALPKVKKSNPNAFQAKGDWETGVPNLSDPDDVFAVIQGAGKLKVGDDLAGELRGVPALFKSKNGQPLDRIAESLIESYPHLGGGDRAVVKEQLLDTMTRYVNLRRDKATTKAKAGQEFDVTGTAPARRVPGNIAPEDTTALQQALDWWDKVGGEAGRLRLPDVTPLTAGAGRLADDLRKLLAPATRGPDAQRMAGIVREHAAELAAKTARAEKDLAQGALMFEKLSDAERYRFIDALESGRPSKPGSTAATLRELLDGRRADVQRLGVGALKNYIENYFPHIWKQSDQAENVLGQMLGKRPLEGSKAFLRQRTIPTTAEGVAAGLEPVTTNPVGLTLLKLREMDKFVMGQHVFKEMKDTGLAKFVKLGDQGPTGWAKVNDKIARVLEPTDQGMVLRGEYYAPEPAARVLNNYLSPGLRGAAPYDMLRGVGNAMNQAQLGLSAFHLAFVSYDSMISKAALGLQQVFGGQVMRGLGNIAHGSSPAAPFTTFLKGNKVLKEYFSPGSQGAEMAATVDQIIKGGGRVQMDKFYKNSSLANFRTALHEGRYLAAGAHSPWALLEATAWPLMEYIVPRMKLGAFADLAQFELGRLPAGASPDRVRAALGGAWDSIDNRLGQMVYDNLFWDKTVKDLGMVGTRSLGWNLGTVREIGGGLGRDLPKALSGGRGFTPRMAYTTTLPMVTALYGGMMHYLATGQGPSEMTDYFFPKTGATRPGGTDDRLSLPTYMRDVFAYYNHPADTVMHKVHPLLSTTWEMIQNRDFYGAEIRNPDDPLVQRWVDGAEHVANAFVPFSARGFGSGKQASPSELGAVAGFLGHTPAPVAMTRTAEQQAAIERKGNRAAHRKKERNDAMPSAMDRFREYIK